MLSDWPFLSIVDLQAQDRAHRIGQKKTVRVFRLITDGTVDVKVIERADRKLFLDAAVIQQGRLMDKLKGMLLCMCVDSLAHSLADCMLLGSSLSRGDLMTMVKFGADEILKNKEGTITDEDIDILLTKSEERTTLESSKLTTEMKHNLANFAVNLENSEKLGQEISIFSFEGEDFKMKRKSMNGSSNALIDVEGLTGANGEEISYPSADNLLFINIPQREKKRDTSVHWKQLIGGSMKSSLINKLMKKKVYHFPEHQVCMLFMIADYACAYEYLICCCSVL